MIGNFTISVFLSMIFEDEENLLLKSFWENLLLKSFWEITKIIPTNVISVILQTSDATYRNSCKAHVFRVGQDASSVSSITSVREIQADIWIIW